MPEKVVAFTKEISRLTGTGLKNIHDVTRRTKTIAINAMIEAARIGERGRSFAVVAEEVGKISEQVTEIANDLETKLSARVGELDAHGKTLIRAIRGTRLVDLASNMIDIVDRNLYERSCDVRWWATDAAVVDALQAPRPEEAEKRGNRCGDRHDSLAAHASKRLAVILGAYTVYVDIWVADLSGRVVASGRQGRYPGVLGSDVSRTAWFQEAVKTKSGDDFAVSDIEMNPVFQSTVATYAAAVREGGQSHGKVVGVLGVFFDWAKQSRTVVDNVRIADEEKAQTRCLILDAKHRVIASTGGAGVLTEHFPLNTEGNASGSYTDPSGRVVGFFRTVGYETYAGLGWYGVIVQEAKQAAEALDREHPIAGIAEPFRHAAARVKLELSGLAAGASPSPSKPGIPIPTDRDRGPAISDPALSHPVEAKPEECRSERPSDEEIVLGVVKAPRIDFGKF
ncbi:MAG TPA: methyl-accepting chemotaxis protein [Candidatus Methylacidiphilales bacterium]